DAADQNVATDDGNSGSDAADSIPSRRAGVIDPSLDTILNVGDQVIGLVGCDPVAGAAQHIQPVNDHDTGHDCAYHITSNVETGIPVGPSTASGVGHFILAQNIIVSGHTNGHFHNNAPFLCKD